MRQGKNMQKKTKKVKKPSRLDKQGAELAAQGKVLFDMGHRMTRQDTRMDKIDATLAREIFNIRESFTLTDDWRNRALKAESRAEGAERLVLEWAKKAEE